MSSNFLSGICEFRGYREAKHCGYCKNRKQEIKVMNGAVMRQVKVSFYNQLLGRNWNRCGTYYYQPLNSRTCCPQYQNRVNVLDFKMSSKHRKVVAKLNHWLKTGERKLPKNISPTRKRKKKKKKKLQETRCQSHQDVEKVIYDAIISCMKKGLIPKLKDVKVTIKENRKMKGIDTEKYQLCSSIVFHLFGLLSQQLNSTQSSEKIKLSRAQLAKLIVDECFLLMKVHSDIFTDMKPLSSGFIHISIPKEKFQQEQDNTNEGEDEAEEDEEREREQQREEEEDQEIVRDDVEGAIITTFVPPVFSQESYQLYRKFQIAIHKEKPDEVTEKSYFNFLCETSLIPEKNGVNQEEDNKPMSVGYGTCHYLYRLQKSNKLIAMSVLDVLPGGVVSYYFLHDPDYRFLELGKYSVVHEIDTFFDRDLISSKFPEFKYYYFAFYVHDCQKMKYKAQFKPQQVLCNVTWKWCDLHKHAIKGPLSHSKFGRFYPEENEKQDDEEEEEGEVESSTHDMFATSKFDYDGKTKGLDPKNMLVYHKGDVLTRDMFGILYGKLRKETERKMDAYFKLFGEWSDSVAFYVSQRDIEPKITFSQAFSPNLQLNLQGGSMGAAGQINNQNENSSSSSNVVNLTEEELMIQYVLELSKKDQ